MTNHRCHVTAPCPTAHTSRMVLAGVHPQGFPCRGIMAKPLCPFSSACSWSITPGPERGCYPGSRSMPGPWLNHGRSQILDAPAKAIPADVPSVYQQSTAMLHPVGMIQPEMYKRDLNGT